MVFLNFFGLPNRERFRGIVALVWRHIVRNQKEFSEASRGHVAGGIGDGRRKRC